MISHTPLSLPDFITTLHWRVEAMIHLSVVNLEEEGKNPISQSALTVQIQ